MSPRVLLLASVMLTACGARSELELGTGPCAASRATPTLLTTMGPWDNGHQKWPGPLVVADAKLYVSLFDRNNPQLEPVGVERLSKTGDASGLIPLSVPPQDCGGTGNAVPNTLVTDGAHLYLDQNVYYRGPTL